MKLSSLKDDSKIIKLKAIIDKKCSVIKAVCYKSQKYLFRGIDDYHATKTIRGVQIAKDVWFLNSPKGRTSLHSSKVTHDFMTSMQNQAGWPLDRTNSIFAISNAEKAREFGGIGLVLPIDGFHFAWNFRFEDKIYSSIDRLYAELDANGAMAGDGYKDAQYFETHIENVVVRMHIAQFPNMSHKEFYAIPEVFAVTKELRFLHINVKTLEDYILWLEAVKADLIVFKQKFAKEIEASNMTARLEAVFTSLDATQASCETRSKHIDPKMILDDLGWKLGTNTKDLVAALKSSHEMMIRGHYIWISERSPYYKPIAEYLHGLE